MTCFNLSREQLTPSTVTLPAIGSYYASAVCKRCGKLIDNVPDYLKDTIRECHDCAAIGLVVYGDQQHWINAMIDARTNPEHAPIVKAKMAARLEAASVVEEYRVCNKCGGDPQPIDNFRVYPNGRRMSVCRTCAATKNREDWQRQKAAQREANDVHSVD